MKIVFEGTYQEFQALFGGSVARPAPSEPVNVSPQTSPVSQPTTAEYPAFTSNDLPWNASNSLPEPPAPVASSQLPAISSTSRKAALAYWSTFCRTWARNFEDLEAEQPDRLTLMQDLGSSPHFVPILVMAYEIGSLQRLVEKGLAGTDVYHAVVDNGSDESRDWLDYLSRIAGNMVQVCHAGVPDLAGTLDHSTKWRRS